MEQSNDPMCSVPVSYLNMLQGHSNWAMPNTPHLDSPQARDTYSAIESGVTPDEYVRMRKERDTALERIAQFEDRAGCALEQIPVEALGDAQNQYVNQQAIDTLKRENEAFAKRIGAAESEIADWRGKYKEAQRALGSATGRAEAKYAPYGFTAAGVPRKKPGPSKRRVG